MRKCAIYNRISIGDQNQLEEDRKELISYCKENLRIDDFVIFEEISSVLSDREEYNNMIEKINNHEFTDLLVAHPDRLFKASYNQEKFDEIVNNISKCNVTLHSIKEV